MLDSHLSRFCKMSMKVTWFIGTNLFDKIIRKLRSIDLSIAMPVSIT
jgi:hypothetical protein